MSVNESFPDVNAPTKSLVVWQVGRESLVLTAFTIMNDYTGRVSIKVV